MTASLREAVALHQAGLFEEAEAAYRAFLAEVPEHPDGVALLGVLCGQRGRADDAIRLGERAVALDPASGLFRFYLGNAYFEAGRAEAAIEAYQRAVQLEPKSPEAWYNLANLLQQKEAWPEAERAYLQALFFQPKHFLARNNLALLYEKCGDLGRALATIQQLVAEAPTFADGWLNLCNLAEQSGEYALAEKAGLIGTRLAPDHPALWFGLGVARNRLEKNAEAADAYLKALALRPDWGEAWDNLGQSYQFANKIEEAEAAYRRRIDLAGQTLADDTVLMCDETQIGNHHWHLALLDLLKGDLRHGFARYRARFDEVQGLKRPAWPRPVWRGENLAGKTILIYDEQGFGDTLMMLRYVPLLKERGAKVWLIAGAPLVPFLRGWSFLDRLFERGEEIDLAFDFFASSFDLPFVFETTVETIPGAAGYLPGHDQTKQNENIERIGLVWTGSPAHKHTMRRCVPLDRFAPLFERKDLRCFSLGRDKMPGDDALLARYGVEDWAPRIQNFADTARLLADLDLVISVDTSTAHLAGGLGQPVFLLLPFAPDWRWGISGDYSPWYASAHLFRQTEPGGWEDVILQVIKALELTKNP